MSLIMIDSFDHYGTLDGAGKITDWDGEGSGTFPPTYIDYTNPGGSDTGRKGSAGVVTDRSGNSFEQGVTVQADDYVQVGLAYKSSSGTNRDVIHIADAGGAALSYFVVLQRMENGAYRVRNGANGTFGTTLGLTRARLWHTNRYNYIEFRVRVHATLGEVYVYVNGRRELALTGQDTVGNMTPSPPIGVVSFRIDGFMDDMYICDSGGPVAEMDASSDTMPGDCYVEALVAVVGNGFHTDWTPTSGGDHGAMVDDALDPDPEPSDKRTYHPNDDERGGEVPEFDANESLTVGDKDSYNHADIVQTQNTVIYGIQYNPWIKKDDQGVRTVRPFTRISGTDYVASVSEALSESWIDRFYVWQLNPDTSAQWTVAEVDAAEFGVEVVANP